MFHVPLNDVTIGRPPATVELRPWTRRRSGFGGRASDLAAEALSSEMLTTQHGDGGPAPTGPTGVIWYPVNNGYFYY